MKCKNVNEMKVRGMFLFFMLFQLSQKQPILSPCFSGWVTNFLPPKGTTEKLWEALTYIKNGYLWRHILSLFSLCLILVSFSFCRPFFEGMSHSSSQTEIGSIHSQKSQQRELSCPVSRWQITILILLCDGIWFQPPRFACGAQPLN